MSKDVAVKSKFKVGDVVVTVNSSKMGSRDVKFAGKVIEVYFENNKPFYLIDFGFEHSYSEHGIELYCEKLHGKGIPRINYPPYVKVNKE